MLPLHMQNGHLTASVSQQLKDMCNRSPQLWRERQEELNEQLKAARRDIKDARKGKLSVLSSSLPSPAVLWRSAQTLRSKAVQSTWAWGLSEATQGGHSKDLLLKGRSHTGHCGLILIVDA